jgi:glycerol kinase
MILCVRREIINKIVFQQPSQIMQMKGMIIKPLRSGAKQGWLMDENYHVYKRHGEYKAGKLILSCSIYCVSN